MKIKTYDNKEEWELDRRGKVTGSKLKGLVVKRVGTGKKIGFYELIAERIGVPGDGEAPMQRGTRLEEEAIARFEEETGEAVDQSLVIWERDDNPDIAISPDGFIDRERALEVKCLSSARHIEAYLTQKVPDEYEYQVLQYFIVNDDLQTLYFCFYDPRVLLKEFFYLEITRESIQEQVDEMLEYERTEISEINSIVSRLIEESAIDSG